METVDGDIYKPEGQGYFLPSGRRNNTYIALAIGIINALVQSFSPTLNATIQLDREVEILLHIPVILSAVYI